jgi:hypothetical protein
MMCAADKALNQETNLFCAQLVYNNADPVLGDDDTCTLAVYLHVQGRRLSSVTHVTEKGRQLMGQSGN